MGRPRKVAITPEAREQEMINLAMSEAERRLRDGTAPAPLVMMFAKSGLGRERLERQRLEEENTLLRAKVEQIETSQQSNEKLDRVYRALRTYQGDPVEDEEYDDEPEDLY